MNKFTSVYVMLGGECNFKCRYCLQTPNTTSPKQLNKESLQFLSDLANTALQQQEKLNIMFWGGEPLLYMDSISIIVDTLKDTVTYSLVTNGSLLSPDNIHYINSNDIHVTLSHDGPNTIHTRGYDVFDSVEFQDLFKTIKSRSVCSVISAYNYDLEALFTFYELLDPGIVVSVEELKLTWDIPADISNLNYTKLKESFSNSANKAIQDIKDNNYTNRVRFFLPYLMDICSTWKADYLLRCAQLTHVLNMDLEGNIYNCHNLCTPCATIHTPYDELLRIQYGWVKKNLSSFCESCELFGVCKGGCPNDRHLDDGSKYGCRYYALIYNTVVFMKTILEQDLQCIACEPKDAPLASTEPL